MCSIIGMFRYLQSAFARFHLGPAPALQRNLAAEVINVLDWWNYDSYVRDLTSLVTHP